MSGTITEHNLFKPRPSKAEPKADITNYAARAIIGAEAEAKLAAVASPAKPSRVKSMAPRRVRSSM